MMKHNDIRFFLFTASLLFLTAEAYALTPEGLMADLTSKPGLAVLSSEKPFFSWCFPAGEAGDRQTAYQIQVATGTAAFRTGKPDLWDSGRVDSDVSLSIPYAGTALPAEREICWRVRAWDAQGKEGAWSQALSFRTTATPGAYQTPRYPLAQRHVSPVRLFTNKLGRVVVDFGKDAWGWVELLPPMSMEFGGDFILHIGEKLDGESVDTKPGATIRYAKVNGALTTPGIYRVPFQADKRNTYGGKEGAAILLPQELGVVMPFRYVEVAACPYPVTRNTIRMIAVNYPFDNKASAFVSSDPDLDRIYDFCKYSIKATSFTGVYVDGDRERIPYEADAYINQLCHYAVDREYTIARYSHEYLIKHPTWPTEWKQHSIMMAWADWMWTADKRSLENVYSSLKNDKLLATFARESDGLLVTKGDRSSGKNGSDIVDWPPCERDGFEFKPVNTVINAFYCLNLRQMASIAAVLGKEEDAAHFQLKADQAVKAFHAAFFNNERGCYVDGEGARHASQHANIFALAFGIVPEHARESVAEFVVSRGMSCSPYVAQYLLEALFLANREDEALRMITRSDRRGWLHMMEQGSTITMEAWDPIYKPNLDWNHAWGAAPVNIIARYVLGVRPLKAGFAKMLIRPQTGSLTAVEGFVPTASGTVRVGVRHAPRGAWRLSVKIPANTEARVEAPTIGPRVTLDGKTVSPVREGDRYVLENVPSGSHCVEVLR